MPIPTVLSTSKVSSNDSKGRKATDLFRAAYNKAGLDNASAQLLNENPEFPVLLTQLIKELSGTRVIQETHILRREGSIAFPARNKLIDPNEFFNRGEIFLLSDSFRKCILPALMPVSNTPNRIYEIGRLKRVTYDYELLRDLPNQHLINWEDIASLTEMYPNGKTGVYLLYMKGVGGQVFSLYFGWDSKRCKWGIESRELNQSEDDYWPAGRLVLCPSHKKS